MRAYVHVGMPKAGSTAIQLSLATCKADLLRTHGIYYCPSDSKFQNDFDIYCAHKGRRRSLVHDLLFARQRAAADLGAKKIVFSCERFFEIAENPDEFAEFIRHFEEMFEGSLEFVVVYRGLRSFIKSHATQLLYNGGITYGNMGLAFWIVRMLKAHYDLPFKVNFLNYDLAKRDACLYGKFLELVSGQRCHEKERYENITPPRPLAYAAILGQICKLESLFQSADINSPEIDSVRDSINQRFDQLWLSGAERKEEREILDTLSRALDDRIEKYADLSIKRLDDPGRAFLEKLGSSMIVENGYDTKLRSHERAVAAR